MRRQPQPPSIYAIADAATVAPRSLSEAVEEMAAAGIRWIQLRAKLLEDREFCREIERSCRVVEGGAVELWVDDRADLAALFPVAGLHVGHSDLPPAAARRVVGERIWIGRSTHSEEQFREAVADPQVDVVALGPIFATTSKEHPDPVVGLELLARLAPTTDKPVVAIGGIDHSNVTEILAAGADSAAILGALCHGDIGSNSRRIRAAVEE